MVSDGYWPEKLNKICLKTVFLIILDNSTKRWSVLVLVKVEFL